MKKKVPSRDGDVTNWRLAEKGIALSQKDGQVKKLGPVKLYLVDRIVYKPFCV